MRYQVQGNIRTSALEGGAHREEDIPKKRKAWLGGGL